MSDPIKLTTWASLIHGMPARRFEQRPLRALRVDLPTVRVWSIEDGSPNALVYEALRTGIWSPCQPADLTETEMGDVRAYLRTGGLSADPRVAAITVHVGSGRLEVRYRDTTTDAAITTAEVHP